jgi:hypothetical protein
LNASLRILRFAGTSGFVTATNWRAKRLGGENSRSFSNSNEQGGVHYHRLANMSKPKQKSTTVPRQEAIDRLVVSQADDDSVWGPGSHVKRPQTTSLSIPGNLAARAAFLAKLHRESGVGKWVERVVRERVELEERAFVTAKKEIAS